MRSQQDLTIQTSIKRTATGGRLHLEVPAEGFAADEIDALVFALQVAKRQLEELQAELPPVPSPLALQEQLQTAAVCPGGT